MTERPILFSAPMVRAILAGTKTQTRRIVKPQPTFRNDHLATDLRALLSRCPYGKPGDRLWVREAWRAMAEHDASRPIDIPWREPIVYEASRHPDTMYGKLRPGMFMPRWDSRITLEITGVRVERLQDISEADAIAEGAPLHIVRAATRSRRLLAGARCHRLGFRDLWESINGPDSWDANPWVWAISFKRVET